MDSNIPQPLKVEMVYSDPPKASLIDWLVFWLTIAAGVLTSILKAIAL